MACYPKHFLVVYHLYTFYNCNVFFNPDAETRMVEYSFITKFCALVYFLVGIESYFIFPTAWYYIKSFGESKFFLAVVLTSYNIGNIICGPVFGFLTDRFGQPRNLSICCFLLKVSANVLYSVNASPYFPLFARLLSGFGGGFLPIFLGQIALLTDEASRGANYVFIEGMYSLGCAVGPVIASFLSFRINILGWTIDEGNSPGIIMIIIWLFCLIGFLFLPLDIWVDNAADRNLVLTQCDEEKDKKEVCDLRGHKRKAHGEREVGLTDLRISCLQFLTFSNVVFTEMSAFYTPVLGIDHLHLKVIHVKLIFMNCSIFALFLFLSINQAVQYVDERKLLLIPLFMDITGIILLMYLAFFWDQVDDIQYYILLIYLCLSVPYLSYPLGNSIVSKFSKSENAAFIQGFSYAIVHFASIAGRIGVSFVLTKASLTNCCLGAIVFWSIGMIWYAIMYKTMKPNY